jgi:large subunit ribosomal protein L23
MAIVQKLKKTASDGSSKEPVTKEDPGKEAKEKKDIIGKDLSEEERTKLLAIVPNSRVTEKTSMLQGDRTYTFNVHSEATKAMVKHAVERLYHVKITDVHVVNIPRKSRMRGRLAGWKKGYRKMMVRIAEGQNIEIA